MGLADALENTRDAQLWKQLCQVHKAMLDHPTEADTIFEFCTNRIDKPATTLAETFDDNGINIGNQSIVRHRRRTCQCDKRMPERYDAG